MRKTSVIFLLLFLSILSCKKRSSISCPTYWEGDKGKEELRGTNMTKDEDGNIIMKDNLPSRSPVKKNINTGLVDKKKDKKMSANYYRGKKKR